MKERSMQTRNLRSLLDAASAHVEHQVERIEAELRFAGTLCDLHSEQASTWRPLIRRAREVVAAELAGGRVDAVQAAVVRAEELMAPIGAAAKEYTVHCVGHAHIDMNWMWSWPETVAVTVDSFSTVLKLMEEYPEFCFSQSQASTYAIVERHRPDLLRRIVRRVKQGRWEVTASHWVEGDKNLAGGESLCRHLLYTRRYVQKLFGLEPEDVPIDWSPDTFGHAVTVPSYLVRGGVKYLYMHRPGAHGPERPWLFWWQGPDGSRVLVRNDSKSSFAYNGVVTAAVLCRDLALFARETGLRDHMFIYGVGDHGGGPTRRDIHQITEMDAWPVFPNVRFGKVKEYMDLVAPRADGLPVLDCELNFEFAGCYTTQSVIKRDNRYGENRLVDAEIAASVAWAGAGLKYPTDDFQEGWRDILFSHFHDILPGSGVHDTRAYTHGLYQKTVAATAQIETQALRQLAGRIDTSAAGEATKAGVPASRLESSTGAGVGFRAADGGLPQSDQSAGAGNRPFLLFNPTAADRNEVVQATLWATRAGGAPLGSRSFAVRAADGRTAPAQVVDGGHYWGHEYAILAFPARVPGLGYSQYTIVETENAGPDPKERAWQAGKEHHCPYSMRERSPEGLENDSIRLEVEPTTGGILRLVDKQSGAELVAPAQPAPALEYIVEQPHGMSAWLVHHQEGPAEYPVLQDLRRTLKGPHKAAIEADLRIRESDFTLTYELRAGEPRLHIGIRGTWFQRGTPQTGIPALNFTLPLAVEEARARYEVPFGAIDREFSQREEVPTLQWAQVTGKTGDETVGCLLVNDSKHGHSLEDSTLRLTLIRSSYEPDILPEIGQHEIHLALRPFAGEMPVAEAIREGQEFNHPVRVVGTDAHAGDLPAKGKFVRVGPERVALSAVKKAEEGDALVLRLFNPTERRITARVEFDAELVGKVKKAVEVDLVERPLVKSTARVAGSRVSVAVPARGIATVRVEVAGR